MRLGVEGGARLEVLLKFGTSLVLGQSFVQNVLAL